MTNPTAARPEPPKSNNQSNRTTISAVIISRNEAEVIEACLQSVAEWVDEIVVVDMHSTDGTREIVRRYTDRVIDHERLDYADPARNFALTQTTGDWILMLDPDERVPQALAQELQRVALHEDVDVVILPFETRVFGAPIAHSGYQEDAHPRFFRRSVISWPVAVHGSPDLSALRVKPLAKGVGLSVLHDTWRTVDSQLDRVRRYAPREVELLQQHGGKFGVAGMLGSMWLAFRRSLVSDFGYRDGVRGLFVALLLANYRMVIYMELWEAQGRPEDEETSIFRYAHYLGIFQRALKSRTGGWRLGVVAWAKLGGSLASHGSKIT